MNARLFLGNLSSKTTERDVEDFFRKFGRLNHVTLKSGFGFVEFENPGDAEDAIRETNGRDLCGNRAVVELAKPRGSGDFRKNDRRDSRDSYRGDSRTAFRPNQTRYRLAVENLSSRITWKDIKSMLKPAGWVTFADISRDAKNTGVVYFERHEDLKRAIDKFQGEDVNGRRIKLIDETRSNSRSRSRSPRRSRKRSVSRSVSPHKYSRSKSRSPRKRSRQDSRSVSPPVRKSRGSSRSRNNSRSVSPPVRKGRDSSRSQNNSRSISPKVKTGRKESRSRSYSPV